MKIDIELENGKLPDRFGKYAPAEYCLDGEPIRSFPIAVSDVPEGTKSLALTFLDWDAIPVGGFCWIHWIACNIPPEICLIPENISAAQIIPMVQGSNSAWSKLAGGRTDPNIIHRYTGPYPPDKDHKYTLTLYALDCTLDLAEGYYLNEFLWTTEGHVLAVAAQHVVSRA